MFANKEEAIVAGDCKTPLIVTDKTEGSELAKVNICKKQSFIISTPRL